MLRWLGRLLLVGLILGGIGFAVSRFLGQDDDFDDFDDIEEGFEYTETPVEIDVPADAAPSNADATQALGSDTTQALGSDTTQALGSNDTGADTGADDGAGTQDTGGSATEADTWAADDGGAEATSGASDASTSDGAQDTADGASTDGLADLGLQEIKGIGAAYEQRLMAIGINNPGDLVKADPSTVSEQLNVIGGQAEVEDWISQARDLAAQVGAGSDGGSESNS